MIDSTPGRLLPSMPRAGGALGGGLKLAAGPVGGPAGPRPGEGAPTARTAPGRGGGPPAPPPPGGMRGGGPLYNKKGRKAIIDKRWRGKGNG